MPGELDELQIHRGMAKESAGRVFEPRESGPDQIGFGRPEHALYVMAQSNFAPRMVRRLVAHARVPKFARLPACICTFLQQK